MKTTCGLLAPVEPELAFQQRVTQALSPNPDAPSTSSNCFFLEGQRSGGAHEGFDVRNVTNLAYSWEPTLGSALPEQISKKAGDQKAFVGSTPTCQWCLCERGQIPR